MDIEQKYLETFNEIDSIIQSRRDGGAYVALGYTSNLDLLCEFQVDRLNELLALHMPQKTLTDMKIVKTIHTISELLETMVFYCVRGIGGEADVEDMEIVKANFTFGNGMGGTGVQAALALAEVGCPSMVHLTDDSPEVCQLLNVPFVYTVSKDGRFVHTNEIQQSKEQEIHFIIQFKKGDVIRLGNQEMEIPCSNRLILTKITVNELVPFEHAYFKWIEEHAHVVNSNVLSSFNAIQDPSVLIKRLEYLKQHLLIYATKNPTGITFFEDAHYHNDEIKKICLNTIYSHVDIVSLNEEELKSTMSMYQVELDTENIDLCIQSAEFLKKTFGIKKGVIVHTKDYAMYVGSKINVEIEKGLMLGNMVATAKACNGVYGTRKQVQEVLGFELSAKGLRHYQEVKNKTYNSTVILVPSKYIDKPKYTIGLGDSFVGGVQMCF